MLNSLRESAGSWVVKVLLGLLVISFAAWGIGDIIRFRPDSAVVKVGDQQVSGNEFLDHYNREFRKIQARLGPSIDQETARRLGLVDQVVSQLVTQALFDQATSDLGLASTDGDLRQAIEENPAFHDNFGKFSRLVMEQQLQRMSLSQTRFEELMRHEFSRSQLLEALVVNAKAPAPLVDEIFDYQQEKRVFEILSFPHADMPVAETPDEAALAAYHDAHKDQFTAPEYREITFLTLRPEDLMRDIKVDEADVRQLYDYRIGDFTKEAKRDVEQIVVQDKAEAEKISARLKEGGDFYAVAEEMAGADKKTVALGLVTKGDLPPEVADKVFDLAKGEISDALESPFGWHVFRVLAVEPGGVTPYEEVHDELEKELKHEKAVDEVYEQSTRVVDALAGGARIEEIAEELHLTHGRIAAVDRDGRNPEGQPVDGLPDIPGLLVSAFSVEIGEEPQLRDADDNSYYLVRVDKITAPALRPLAEVRDKVREQVMAERRTEAAAAKAKALAEKLAGGGDLTEAAAEAGGKVETTVALTRNDAGRRANFDPTLVETLFKLPTGGYASGAAADGSSHLVVRVKSIEAPDPTAEAGIKTQISQAFRQSMQNDIQTLFRAAMEKKYGAEINQRAIDQIFGEGGQRS